MWVTRARTLDVTLNTLLVILLTLPLVMFSIIFPNDWFAWVLFYFTFIIAVINKEVRKNKVFYPFLFVLAINQLVAITNSYLFTVPGADADASTFHEQAVLISRYGEINLLSVGSEFYTNFLALWYRLFGESLFLSSQISVLALTAGMMVLLKLSNLVELDLIKKKYVLLFFGLLPSVIFFTSVPLRESMQILAFSLLVYYTVQLKKKKNIKGLLKILITLGALGILHNGFLAFTPFFGFVVYAWVYMKPKFSVVNVLSVIMGIGISFAIIAFLQTGIVSSSATNALLSGNALDFASNYRTSNLNARAAYGVALDTSSFIGLIITFPQVLFFYLFSPLPWQVGNAMDLVGLFESMIRFLLIVCGLRAIKESEGNKKSYLKFYMIMFFLVEIMWSTGTLNWGTAMRHHVIGYGLLVIVGGSKLFNIFIKKPKQLKNSGN